MRLSLLDIIMYICMIVIISLSYLWGNLEIKELYAVLIIFIFLIIFSQVFKSEGNIFLRALMILIAFLFLPLFLVFYMMSLSAVLVVISGIFSVYAIIRLNIVQLKWNQINE